MRLPNGYGGVVKLSGNRRRPYAARITTGWYFNESTLKKLKVLFNQLYAYTMKHEIVVKDYSEFVNIVKYKKT